MKSTTIVKNWVEGTTPEILENIHEKNINISIYIRDIDNLQKEIDKLLQLNIKFNSCGDIDTILNEITKHHELENCCQLIQDIHNLLQYFKKVSQVTSFRVLLSTINTNMCRKFHVDMNDLRMLCTYSGPGTLWVTEENINRNVLGVRGDNSSILIDENQIQQVTTGAVLILKGTKYPKNNAKAVVHRSPTIEKNNVKRLLLRIDTN